MKINKKILSYALSAAVFASSLPATLSAQASETQTPVQREYLTSTGANRDLYYNYLTNSYFEKSTDITSYYMIFQTDGTLSTDFFSNILKNKCGLGGSEFYVGEWAESFPDATFEQCDGVNPSEFDENTYFCCIYKTDTSNSTYLIDDLKTWANYMHNESSSIEEAYIANIFNLNYSLDIGGVNIFVDEDSDFTEENAKTLFLAELANNDNGTFYINGDIKTGSYPYFNDEKCIYLDFSIAWDNDTTTDECSPKRYEAYAQCARMLKSAYDDIKDTSVFIEYCDCFSLTYDIKGELVSWSDTEPTTEATEVTTTTATSETDPIETTVTAISSTRSTEATTTTKSTSYICIEMTTTTATTTTTTATEQTEIATENEKTTELTSEAQRPLYGDSSCDGNVSISDVILLNKYIVGSVSLEDEAIANSDCNGDGKLDASDTVLVLKLNITEYSQSDMPIRS